ncbi:MAG: NHL repeat-containing protein [Candidatus Nitrosocaldus sp.]
MQHKVLIILAVIGTAALLLHGDALAANYSPIQIIGGPDPSTEPGQFNSPYGVKFYGNKLFVADLRNNRIQIFEYDGSSWGYVSSFFSNTPTTVEVYNDEIYVLEHRPHHHLNVYDMDGNLVRSIGGSNDENRRVNYLHEFPGKFFHMVGLAVDDEGRIMVGDSANQRVQVFTNDGQLLFIFNGYEIYDALHYADTGEYEYVVGATADDRFATPMDVDVYDNMLVTIERRNGRIQVFELNYGEDGSIDSITKVASFGGVGSLPGYMSEPTGIAYDSNNGWIIASDTRNGRIQVFDINGNLQFFYGSTGSGERNLKSPRLVDVSSDGLVAVADQENNRIVILQLNPELPGDMDQPVAEPIEESLWYHFDDHREMFDIQFRIAASKGIDVYSAREMTVRALDWVVNLLRSMPSNDPNRLNIPWSSSLMGDVKSNGDVIYSAGCVISKPGSGGIGDPRSMHSPPPVVGDALFCSAALTRTVTSTTDVRSVVNSIEASFIDPDGSRRSVPFRIPYGEVMLPRAADFNYNIFGITLDKDGPWMLSVEFKKDGMLVDKIEVPFHVGNSYQFSSRDGLVDAIGSALSNSGFTDDEVQQVIQVIESSDISLPEQGTLIVEARRGSLYAFACILPHDPPLNIGESVQCLVIFMSLGSQVTVDDLHVYANAPSTIINIQSWNWAPNTIPDPFIWLSPPINMSEAGTWSIVADFTRGGSVVLSIPVTFNVVPESMIGIAGVLGTSLAVLAYRMRRKNGKSN